VGYVFFLRDFKLLHFKMGRLVYQSFAASVIGATGTYGVLTLTGATGQVDTTLGLLFQGGVAGLLGLTIAVLVLRLLGNIELAEAVSALHQRIRRTSVTPLEATDVSS
jgi:FtsH-binding integral membrane protein